MTQPTLIETLYSESEGYLDIRALLPGSKPKQTFVRLGDWQSLKAFIHQHRGMNLYFGIATRDGAGGKKENIVHIPAVWVEQDFKSIPGEAEEANRILEAFPLRPTIKVLSGGGNHLYWKLKEPSDKTEIEKIEAIMRGLCHRLSGDPASTDASRILRIPNTQNHKYKPPRKVILEHCNGTEFSLSDFDDFLDYDAETSKVHLPADQNNMHLVRIMACKFMAHCRDDAATLPEPEWRAMITQLMKETGGVPLIHELSKPHPGYKRRETEKKILDALSSTGPQSCSFIQGLWNCGLDCGVKSPAALAYRLTETHIKEELTSETSVTKETSAHLVTNCNQVVTKSVTTEQFSKEHEYQLKAKVMDWLETCDGVFLLKDLAQELLLNDSKCIRTKAYNYLKLIIKRLIDERVLERVGAQRGVYCKVENTLEEMDWYNAAQEEYDIQLPLGLTDLCRIYPRNIIVIAGENNAAKTLLSLYIAKLNAEFQNVRFFNSEMDPSELRNRLFSFDDTPVSLWQRIHFYQRSQNFHQCIFPNDLNIIDFLEIHEDYYKVGGWIRQIHDRLENGIAVINLQKKTGSDTGRGGEVTTEKARLYVSLIKMLDPLGRPFTRAKIVKCKAPRDPRHHPYGWVRDFRIHRGWELEPFTTWEPERKEK